MKDFRIDLCILITAESKEVIEGKVDDALAKLAELDPDLVVDDLEITE